MTGKGKSNDKPSRPAPRKQRDSEKRSGPPPARKSDTGSVENQGGTNSTGPKKTK